MNELTSDQVRIRLWEDIKKNPGRPMTQTELAARIGVSLPFLNEILRGTREPSGKVLDYLGLERVVIYRFRRKNR
jgi:predicted transcriptional regulator